MWRVKPACTRLSLGNRNTYQHNCPAGATLLLLFCCSTQPGDLTQLQYQVRQCRQWLVTHSKCGDIWHTHSSFSHRQGHGRHHTLTSSPTFKHMLCCAGHQAWVRPYWWEAAAGLPMAQPVVTLSACSTSWLKAAGHFSTAPSVTAHPS